MFLQARQSLGIFFSRSNQKRTSSIGMLNRVRSALIDHLGSRGVLDESCKQLQRNFALSTNDFRTTPTLKVALKHLSLDIGEKLCLKMY